MFTWRVYNCYLCLNKTKYKLLIFLLVYNVFLWIHGMSLPLHPRETGLRFLNNHYVKQPKEGIKIYIASLPLIAVLNCSELLSNEDMHETLSVSHYIVV